MKTIFTAILASLTFQAVVHAATPSVQVLECSGINKRGDTAVAFGLKMYNGSQVTDANLVDNYSSSTRMNCTSYLPQENRISCVGYWNAARDRYSLAEVSLSHQGNGKFSGSYQTLRNSQGLQLSGTLSCTIKP